MHERSLPIPPILAVGCAPVSLRQGPLDCQELGPKRGPWQEGRTKPRVPRPGPGHGVPSSQLVRNPKPRASVSPLALEKEDAWAVQEQTEAPREGRGDRRAGSAGTTQAQQARPPGGPWTQHARQSGSHWV